MQDNRDVAGFDSNAYTDFPFLARFLSSSVESGVMDPDSARNYMKRARETTRASAKDIRKFMASAILPALSTDLKFTGLHMEYRGVVSDEEGRNVFAGTPFGEGIPKEEFVDMVNPFGVDMNLFEFQAWIIEVVGALSNSIYACSTLKNKWAGRTGYVWFDGDSVTGMLLLPPDVDEDLFKCLNVIKDLDDSDIRRGPLDVVDAAKMKAAIADRFMVSPDDVIMDAFDGTEETFTEKVTINISGGLASSPGMRALKSSLEAIAAFGEFHQDEPAHYDQSTEDFMDAVSSIFYGAMDKVYDHINLGFSNGQLIGINLGNLLILDNRRPSIIRCLGGVHAIDEDNSPEDDFAFSDDEVYEPRADIKPIPLSSTVFLPAFNGKYGDFADALFTLFHTLVLPKMNSILQAMLRGCAEYR